VIVDNTESPSPRLESADPWRRIMSATYEFVILFGVVFFFYYAFSSLTRLTGAPGLLRNVGQGFLFLVMAVYFTWFWSRGRRTLPMKTMGLMVVDKLDQPVKPSQAFTRYAIALGLIAAVLAAVKYTLLVFGVLFLLPIAWTIIDKDKRALYDVLSGTRLVVKEVSAAEKRTNPVA
jgi:uncharacterized RDD family membrane protein YckC